MHQTAMLSDDTAFGVEKIARLRRLSRGALDKAGIIAVRYKADVLTVRLSRIGQHGFFRQTACLRLGQSAERKFYARELLLRHGIQKIRLILVVIRRSLEQNPLCGIIILNAGIVTGRNAPAADITGTAQQRIKLDVFVAVNARIRRQAALIAGNKPVNDLFMKNIAHIKDIMINTQTRAHAACVRDVIGRAARTRLFADIALIIQRHRHARHVIALLQQQHCTRRAVHAAAHGCENLFLHSMVLSSKRTAPLP